jgi:predicted metal-dependent peptidase
MDDNNYRPKAVVYLTDGYVESQYDVAAGPVLWGVVDNPGFVPIRGKKIDISSMDEGR